MCVGMASQHRPWHPVCVSNAPALFISSSDYRDRVARTGHHIGPDRGSHVEHQAGLIVVPVMIFEGEWKQVTQQPVEFLMGRSLIDDTYEDKLSKFLKGSGKEAAMVSRVTLPLGVQHAGRHGARPPAPPRGVMSQSLNRARGVPAGPARDEGKRSRRFPMESAESLPAGGVRPQRTHPATHCPRAPPGHHLQQAGLIREAGCTLDGPPEMYHIYYTAIINTANVIL